VVTSEAIRKWCRKFGQQYATQLRRRRPRPGDTWHLEEVFLTSKGEHHYLWRAVDQDGQVLDILVQRRRDKPAAKKFPRKLLKGLTCVPRVIITDKLQSYGAAKREILPGVGHRQHRSLKNRAESPHQPTRQRERHMRRFKSPGRAQRFLAASGPIAQHFRTSAHTAIACPRPRIVRKCGTDFRAGRRSRLYPWPPEGRKRRDAPPSPWYCISANKLTMPAARMSRPCAACGRIASPRSSLADTGPRSPARSRRVSH
jgi:putative transposase